MMANKHAKKPLLPRLPASRATQIIDPMNRRNKSSKKNGGDEISTPDGSLMEQLGSKKNDFK
jgi:hypothetical protein